MCRDCHFSSAQCPQQSRFADTVLTDKTISSPIRKCKRRISQNTLARDRHVDAVNLDVLAFCLRVLAQLKWINLHEKFLVRLRAVRLVK